ncbi:hypothetical protein HNQ71_006403 [Mesorhizobium sangaii]|uniref:Uncharacterized protein n=1 Tax=Mesorhizobium sangaii TaxID=505389 RepID=A0A841PEE5_9HYPH|nr:hypothetical protein [Mesorhizobium sangaii]
MTIQNPVSSRCAWTQFANFIGSESSRFERRLSFEDMHSGVQDGFINQTNGCLFDQLDHSGE